MGVVIRQSIKGTIVVYAGVVLAFLINLVIFPLCFSLEQIGLLRVLSELGIFIAGISSVGMQTSAIIRFFPYFQNDSKGNNGFLWLITLIPIAGFAVFTAFFFLFENAFINLYKDDSPILTQYSYLLLPISFGLMLATIFETYSNANLRIVVPKIIREIVLRIIIITLCFLFFYHIISFDFFSLGYTLIYIIAALLVLVYLSRLGKLHFSPVKIPKPGLGKEIAGYGIYMFFGGMGSLLVNNVDILIIAASPNGDVNNAIYLNAVLMASMIELPGRSIGQISAPIVSEHMKSHNYPEVQKLYKNSSIAQLSIGCLLFTLLWSNIDNIYNIMPKGDQFSPGKYCLLFIGISQLFNMTTSINNTILGLSKHYKFGFYAMLGLGIISFVTNYSLIPRYGILGAAMAKALNIFIYQLTIFLFVYIKTGMNPFTGKTTLPILIMGIAFGISYLMPVLANPFIDIVLRSVMIIAVFVTLSLWFNVSAYFNEIFNRALAFIRLRK